MGTAIMLLIIGGCLVFLNIRGINKEKTSFQSVLNEEKVNMDDVKLEIGDLRKEFAETLLELQMEIVELKEKLDIKENLHINNPKDYKENDIYDDKIGDIEDIIDIDFHKVKNIKNEESKVKNKDANLEKDFNNLRIKEVQDLMDKGLSIEEIADILKVGKGEILLIKELYLK